MTLQEFEQKKVLSEDNKLYKIEQNGVMYVRACDPKHPTYGLPSEIRLFKAIYYWEVGNVGKILWLGSIRVT